MIKNIVPASLLAFSLPATTFALGLGEMKVKSYLDQPFYAEISLIDVGSTSLALVKPEFASLETYEQMGLTKSMVESNLQIAMAKGENGKPVIQITSKEHITDPFIDIVIDLVWPQGQSYKEYTVLLDPPNYALQGKNTRLIVKKPKYNEIARANPVENNMEVQKSYARDLVDNAAPKVRTFAPSEAVSTAPELPSTLTPIASNNQQAAPLVDNVPPIPFMQVAGKPVSVQLASREPVSGVGNWSNSNTELSVAGAAVESLRESNLILNEQLKSLQTQNKKLQVQLDARDKELMQLRSQLDIFIKGGPSVGAQVHAGTSHGSDGNGLFWFLFIIATGGAGFLFWYLKKQQPEQLQAFVAKGTDFVKRTVPQLVPKNKETTEETPIVTPVAAEAPIESVSSVEEPATNENKPSEEPIQDVSNHQKEEIEEVPAEEILPEVEIFNKDDSNIELKENTSEDVTKASLEEPLNFAFEEKESSVKPKEDSHKETSLFTINEPSVEPIEEHSTEENTITMEPSVSETVEPPVFEVSEPVPDDNTVEFETGLYIPQEKTIEAPKSVELSDELARSLEIQDDLAELIDNNPLKSEKALDTLLDLAKTYIGMGDKEAAKHSLDEVMEYGTAAQKAQAKAILDEMG